MGIPCPLFSHPFLNIFKFHLSVLVAKYIPTNSERCLSHLSYPKFVTISINNFIEKDDFSLQYITIENAIAAIQNFGQDFYMGKTDIESAFRLIGSILMTVNVWDVLERAALFHQGAPIWASLYPIHFKPILPPLLNRYTQDNNVHIWARGPAKPSCRLFNIYADMYKYQVLSINERTKAPKPDTKTPKKPAGG